MWKNTVANVIWKKQLMLIKADAFLFQTIICEYQKNRKWLVQTLFNLDGLISIKLFPQALCIYYGVLK